jgi:hypothetical protein
MGGLLSSPKLNKLMPTFNPLKSLSRVVGREANKELTDKLLSEKKQKSVTNKSANITANTTAANNNASKGKKI